MYPKTTAGLIECYTMGLPFFRNTLISNLFYATVLFGVYEAAKWRIGIGVGSQKLEARG